MRDTVARLLLETSQAASLWKVLAEQAVEVLVAATLPGSMRVREVAAYARRFFERFVAVEFGAVVPGDGRERGDIGARFTYRIAPSAPNLKRLPQSIWRKCSANGSDSLRWLAKPAPPAALRA